MRSADAYRHYTTSRKALTSGFGETEHSGRIAVIHIAANHDYVSVDEDCRLWLTHLMPDGWLILDATCGCPVTARVASATPCWIKGPLR